jgi:TatA/E family protein of Tat protein translocase
MFGLGMGELLVILALALIVLGPKKLPDLATTLGKAIRSFRKATQELGDQLEVDETVKQPLRELKAALRDEPPAHRLATHQPAAPASTAAAPVAVAAPTAAAPVAVAAPTGVAPVAASAPTGVAPVAAAVPTGIAPVAVPVPSNASAAAPGVPTAALPVAADAPSAPAPPAPPADKA